MSVFPKTRIPDPFDPPRDPNDTRDAGPGIAPIHFPGPGDTRDPGDAENPPEPDPERE
jgi:hypothetical protein